jgi:hypothetical protein
LLSSQNEYGLHDVSLVNDPEIESTLKTKMAEIDAIFQGELLFDVES